VDVVPSPKSHRIYLFEGAPADESSAAVVKSGIKVSGVISSE
jgi:hypothetical protein